MRFVDFRVRGHQGSVARIDATLDHVQKREDGGTSHLSNLRLAHAYCNSARHTHSEDLLRATMIGAIRNWLGGRHRAQNAYVIAMRRHGDWWRPAA
jgi:5-methylcytosine-specific restriction endonuclease McrA